jgi:acetoin utilization protein AcuC
MTVALIYSPAFARYRFPEHHPMKPERFTLAVELMRAWGLLAEESFGEDRAQVLTPTGVPRAAVIAPAPATSADLRLFHSADYIAAVRAASADPRREVPSMGLGDSDTPTFPDMHEAASLAVGGTVLALDAVLDGRLHRAFNPAGGLHHAHRTRAAGFCVYNDCAIAIERATRAHEGLEVAYVDIDAHHGDGVQEAFHARSDVLTLSVHESGRWLYPGTGDFDDVGEGAGIGFTMNVPLPPGADSPCYELVFREVIQPAIRHYRPDVIVAQIGADSNVEDPLTHLRETIAGQVQLVQGIIELAAQVCEGRIVLTGGGGYEPYSVVPRVWASAMAELMASRVPAELPSSWLSKAKEAAASRGVVLRTPAGTFDQDLDEKPTNPSDGPPQGYSSETALVATQSVVNRVRQASPLLGGGR